MMPESNECSQFLSDTCALSLAVTFAWSSNVPGVAIMIYSTYKESQKKNAVIYKISILNSD